MKKLSYILAMTAASATVLTSCDDALESETKSSFDESIVFSNETLTEYTIFNIYNYMCDPTNGYRGRFLPWYGFNTDIEWYNSWSESGEKFENVSIPRYSLESNNITLNTSSSGVSNGPYTEFYMAIEAANTAIKGIREHGSNSATMKYYLGEALTLRAHLYYDLVKSMGDVPARFEPVTNATMYLKKSSRDVIFKQVLADLDEAVKYLPLPGQGKATTVTRISKAYAAGLYARIALAASGYALRPADGKVGTGDAGSVRLSSDPELQASVLYPKALAHLEEIINSGACKLYSDYEQLWQEQNQFVTDYKGEVLFVIPFSALRGRWNYTFAVRHQKSDQYTSMTSSGQAGPVPTLYFDYEADDIRRDVSCVNFKWSAESNAKQELAGINTWYFGKYRFEWMKEKAGGMDDGCKPVCMRYSDILLMASEIANELGKLDEAKNYFKQVRVRAFNGDEAKALANVDINSKDALFNAIVDERALEFVGEFLRKGDLIRWNMLKSKMDEAKDKMYSLRALEGKYNFMSGRVFYKYKEDGETIEVYGLNEGETEEPGEGWSEYTDSEKKVTVYIKETSIKDGKIESIYENDPDTRQFWPIFDQNLTEGQGFLVNDYGY